MPAADRREPVALTIAGSDSSGGAGIQADLKTFAALGVYGASVITALTAQNTVGVQGVSVVDATFVVQQIDSVLSDLRVVAAKTGMLATAPIVTSVAQRLDAVPDILLVVDPVMVATSGDVLLTEDAIATYRSRLLPRAALVTPNLPEAARLLGTKLAHGVDECIGQARRLNDLGCRAVLLKGGHSTGAEIVDVLRFADGELHLFRHPRIDTPNTHGTGCTLSAAVTAGLARGLPLRDAVATGIDYLAAALAHGANRSIGAGHGPVDHMYDRNSLPPFAGDTTVS